ncbi:tetratricopeptide repeat protein [Budvicia diplopodorum]|uniref:tetratricopeptide repeat protein n=1 Tax=Budvicia diplopodorum TaxID=1119056 RepID=UPI0013597D93|nr:tetratricopeptide repeat protein [Budvicia diplopodorum]
MSKLISVSLALAFCLLLSGCHSLQSIDDKSLTYKEDILLSAKNYNGLIDLYRSWLKQKEDSTIRYKLANYYYLVGDGKSSLYYLQPLMEKPDDAIYLLQAKNLIALKEYDKAMHVTDMLLQRNPENGDAYNLKGIALAESGRLTDAKTAIERSRELFIADDVAINNLAMIAMIDNRYDDSVRLLLPQYLRGRKGDRLLHNLVFSLVKVGDTRYARDIIESEKLSDNSEDIIEALNQVNNVTNGNGGNKG